MKLRFWRKGRDKSFSHYIGDEQASSNKNLLLEECRLHGVSPYVDDVSETSSGPYAMLRGVASEPELERRLYARKALGSARF